ncbi:hypothetical protein NliqN6_1864 [Naganishia liquefaciens]|uniref:non-specific serine/threonine protein kinase n=1 Tax=Naganishia liquefaciens TaxID=104408 RepID=A0A8H3TQQ6_9TREE|nr:hypothetical protein NliqN6_1864 [Naganishia liquefaciens]
MGSPETREIVPTRTFDGTIKVSNLAHNGFHDLITMLPSGSGTGASAFFASTPGNTLDKESYIETRDSILEQEEPISRYDSAAFPVVKGEIAQKTVSTSEEREKGTTSGLARGQRSPRPLPPIPKQPDLRQPPSPIERLPVSPRSVPATGQTPSPLARPRSKRTPPPPVSPYQPMVKAQHLPASPLVPSAVATYISHSPIRDGLHTTQRFTASLANRLGARATPTSIASKTTAKRAPILPGLSNEVKVNGGIAKSGNIDKRTISWPMAFRHVVHANDMEEAQFLLMRWAIDGMGKVADPGWADYMKLLVQQRAGDQQARAIAQSIIAREHGVRRAIPFQTLKVVNGLPSSVDSATEDSGTTPGRQPPFASPGRLTPGWSPLNPIPNPFESAFSPPSSRRVSGEDNRFHDTISTISPVAPLRVRARKSVPPVVTTALSVRQPMTVAPEDIDGMPFPSTPTKLREGVQFTNTASVTTASRHIGSKAVVDLFDFSNPPQMIQPSLATLEKAASIAIFFETLYHALLKPPATLQAAHPDNYTCARERRRLALEDEMDERGLTAPEKEKLRQRWVEAETNNLRERRRKVGLNSFTKMKVIGAFGVVSLVREKETGALYAMKELRKSDMLRKGQEGHVRAEKDILAAAATAADSTSRWIVKLHYSFQDVERLYLVLDFEGGGDLLNLLVERDTFDEGFTNFYVAEMIMALEATHKLGFIHRDVKPDNFLFSKDGHLKISDFGLANSLHWAYDTAYYDQQRRTLLKRHGIDLEEPIKMKNRTIRRKEIEAVLTQEWRNRGQGILSWRDNKRRKMAFSVCGTNSYMSPEVIRGMGYGFSCDWWSLGVIVFECLYGYPPFVSNSRHLTRQKILNWKQTLRFPTKPRLSTDCADFLTKLLCEPEDRLGNTLSDMTQSDTISRGGLKACDPIEDTDVTVGLGDDGAAYIKAHPWLSTIDWDRMSFAWKAAMNFNGESFVEDLHLQKAPYQPNLRNDADTRHFEDDIANEPLIAAGAPPVDMTRDPMLADKKHGDHLLELRKGMAFAGWTYKANKQNIHEQFDELLRGFDEVSIAEKIGRTTRSRPLSL